MRDLHTTVKQLNQLAQRQRSEGVVKMILVNARYLVEMAQQAYEETLITREQLYEYMDYADEAEHYAKGSNHFK